MNLHSDSTVRFRTTSTDPFSCLRLNISLVELDQALGYRRGSKHPQVTAYQVYVLGWRQVDRVRFYHVALGFGGCLYLGKVRLA